MMLSLRPILAMAASVVALAMVSPAHAQTVTPVTIAVNNPSCQNAVAICKMQGFTRELEISDVTTSAGVKCSTEGVCHREVIDSALGVTFHVQWRVRADGRVDVDDLTSGETTQQTDIPGFGAVIGEGRNGSNVYCGPKLASVDGIEVPKINTPTKITFCWASGPCKLSPTKVNEACAAYNGPPGDPAQQRAHYLQEHLVTPTQPINICGCPYNLPSDNPDAGVLQRNAAFCDPSIAFPAPGSCPEGVVSGLSTQGTATSGTNTCQRIISGGRVLYIGDTCF